MLLPNFVVVLFSFNKPNGRFNYTWQRFSLDAWLHPCAAPGMCSSLGLSLKIGVVATLVSTLLGTMVAFALARHRFRGRAAVQPADLHADGHARGRDGLVAADPVRQHGDPARACTTILIAHIMFCLSYVVVTVKARIAGLDPRLEQAAADLYANETQTFLRDHLAARRTGHRRGGAAGVLVVLRRLHHHELQCLERLDHVPDVRVGCRARGTPVQINVIGTAMFLLAVLAVAFGQLVGRRRSRPR